MPVCNLVEVLRGISTTGGVRGGGQHGGGAGSQNYSNFDEK